MKNIHIIPTDKPSRLFYSGNSSKLTLNKYAVLFRVSTQNIYITSDEEIKEGDWILELNDNSVWTIQIQTNTDLSKYKKIILTTDQDLIKDGVQAIDDEFLEWFVKNPSCEEIEVHKIYNDYGETDIFDLVCTSHSFKYKIIIPKEEQKQHLIDIMRGDEELGIYEEPKQETLEEAAEKYKYNPKGNFCFIEGAKCQAERSYSEKEVIQLVSDWTDYRMSEDAKSKVTFKKWFKQFRK